MGRIGRAEGKRVEEEWGGELKGMGWSRWVKGTEREQGKRYLD